MPGPHFLPGKRRFKILKTIEITKEQDVFKTLLLLSNFLTDLSTWISVFLQTLSIESNLTSIMTLQFNTDNKIVAQMVGPILTPKIVVVR